MRRSAGSACGALSPVAGLTWADAALRGRFTPDEGPVCARYVRPLGWDLSDAWALGALRSGASGKRTSASTACASLGASGCWGYRHSDRFAVRARSDINDAMIPVTARFALKLISSKVRLTCAAERLTQQVRGHPPGLVVSSFSGSRQIDRGSEFGRPVAQAVIDGGIEQ